MEKKIILGLDVSTHCIGISVAEYENDKLRLIEVTHLRPKIPTKIKGMESLFMKSSIFREKIETYKDFGITDVIIEEPLVGSNNIETVATLLKFNGMVSQTVYDIFNVVPEFISSYDARKYAYPQLMAVRKFNKKGDVYPIKKIETAIRKNELVLFGAYPFDCEKKLILWNRVSELFPDIEWIYNSKGELKNENFDASDSMVCVLGYIGKLKYGDTEPEIVESTTIENEDGSTRIEYTVSFCGIKDKKTIEL